MKKAIGIIGTIISVLTFFFEMAQENRPIDTQATIEAIIPGGITRETIQLTLPGRSQVITENEYSGLVQITVTGFFVGNEGTPSVDTFYSFGNERQAQALARDSILRINGNVAIPPFENAFPPTFSPNHTYNFSYFLTSNEQPIEFEIDTLNLRSYEGSVRISLLSIPNFGGR
jgi:hypothetical protein